MNADVPRLSRSCDDLLAQIADLVRAVGEEALTRPALGGGGSAAAHLRHCLEYFGCFLGGLPRSIVDYDERPRDPTLERDPRAILARVADQRRTLAERVSNGPDAPLRVRADEVDAAAEEGFLDSCVSRELRALASHTVHHLAIVALLLRLQGVAVDAQLGVAPSTRAHWRRAG
ncbi:MAG TPA: DinB family protein [Myxococcota bacterium]|nr:DinB family protein [Myxococcota bacterium]